MLLGGEVCKILCLMPLRANPERSFCEISRRSKTGGFVVVVVVFTKEVLIYLHINVYATDWLNRTVILCSSKSLREQGEENK